MGSDLRANPRLRSDDTLRFSFQDYLQERNIDDQARRTGVDVCTVEEAVAFLRAMDEGLAM